MIGREDPLRGLPPKIQTVNKASNNLLVGLRVPEIISLFDGSQFEEWRYLSRDQVNFDGVVISVEGIHDHILEPPDPPLWQLGSHGIAVGYCIRISTSNRILSLCLHATKIQTGPNPVVRRVEFRAMSRDPKKYLEDRNKLYHPRRWASQEIVPAVAFNLGPISNSKTTITAEYHDIFEPFYKFIVNELQSVLIRRNKLIPQELVSPQTTYTDVAQKSRYAHILPESKLI